VRRIESLIPNNPKGDIGAVNGTPKFDFEQRFKRTTEKRVIIPHIPRVPPAIMNKILNKDMGSYKFGITKVDIAVRATTIIVGAPMRPAFTAASPTTNPPTILTA
jgi:hypothetical protein